MWEILIFPRIASGNTSECLRDHASMVLLTLATLLIHLPYEIQPSTLRSRATVLHALTLFLVPAIFGHSATALAIVRFVCIIAQVWMHSRVGIRFPLNHQLGVEFAHQVPYPPARVFLIYVLNFMYIVMRYPMSYLGSAQFCSMVSLSTVVTYLVMARIWSDIKYSVTVNVLYMNMLAFMLIVGRAEWILLTMCIVHVIWMD